MPVARLRPRRRVHNLLRRGRACAPFANGTAAMSDTRSPLNPLRTFEVAARLSSLTLAAEELNVSQVAVSRQVKALEEHLGIVLVKRQHRGIELTDEGRQLYQRVTGPLQQIATVSRRISRRGRADILALQSYTTFSQKWLIPRLTQFNDAHPRIEVRLSVSIIPADFERQNLDAAIRIGRGDWRELHTEKLFGMELVPVCSPAFQALHRLAHPDDLARVRLLHAMSRPADWGVWIAGTGARVDPEPGVRFASSTLAHEAAKLDAGVALATRALVEKPLSEGVLVAPFGDLICRNGEAYFLTWPKGVPPSAALVKFVDWVRSLTAAD